MRFAVLVTALILTPICPDCIATRSGLTGGEVNQYLTKISGVLVLRREEDRCRTCGASVTTYSVTRPTD